jgi:IS30 family transposase
MHVSAETIYRSLFVQARGDLRHELTRQLRIGRAMRRPAGARLPDGRGLRPNTLNISQRPAEAADRAVPGHWEGDLIFGRGMSRVATLVEPSTRYLMLVGLPDGHRAELVAEALAAAITTLPRHRLHGVFAGGPARPGLSHFSANDHAVDRAGPAVPAQPPSTRGAARAVGRTECGRVLT